VLAALVSLVPAVTWGVWYLAGIAVVDLVILAATVRALPCTTPACVKGSGATSLLKTGFFASLAVFALAAYFL
jgi:geranylgeranylglycerol-phosphate geranylgeranyltransferase